MTNVPENSGDFSPPAKAGRISYRLSVVIYISALVIVTGVTLTLFSLHRARQRSAASATMLFDQVTSTVAAQTRMHVQRAVPLARTLGALAGNGLNVSDADALAHQLILIFRANPGYAWISYSDRDGAFTGIYPTSAGILRVSQTWVTGDKAGRVMEFEVRANGRWSLIRSEATSYDPRQRPFYKKVAEKKTVAWIGPYVFYDQGVPGVTCAAPSFDKSGELQGVVTVDFDLQTLSRYESNLNVGSRSRIIILTPDGTVLADPEMKFEPQVASPAGGAAGELPRVSDAGDPLARAMYDAIPVKDRHGDEFATSTQPAPGTVESGRLISLRFNYQDQVYLAAAKTFTVDRELTWMVMAAAPESDFFGGAYRDAWTGALVSTSAVLLAVIMGILLARRVSRPILSLVAFMRRVGAGELEGTAALGGNSEFRELSAALNAMLLHLRDRLRLRHSLAVAQQVQQRLLPSSPPKIAGLDVAGHSAYCDETGGDYYDFLVFDPDQSRLFVAIGDVMGHGVAAALPMAGARAVLRNRAPASEKLGTLLGELNEMLVNDLRGTGGFMTMLLAMIDRGNNTIRWASAGHDPIMVYDPVGDRFCDLVGADIPLGIESDAVYEDFSHNSLQEGQVMLLGTDGIWEAINSGGKFYGKDRLHEAIRRSVADSAKNIRDAIVRDIDAFRETAAQKDDITFVVIKILPKSGDVNQSGGGA